MDALSAAVNTAIECPVLRDSSKEPVILLNCLHRVDLMVAIERFGELKNGRVTKTDTCPECSATVEAYTRLRKIAETTFDFMTNKTLEAKINLSEDLDLLTYGASKGKPDSLYLLGEHYLAKNDLTNALKYIQAAVVKDQPAAKMRLFKLYIQQQLGDEIIEFENLKTSISYQGLIDISLGNLIEQGYGLPKPEIDYAISHYLLAFHCDNKDSIPCLVRSIPQAQDKKQLIKELVNKATFLIPELYSVELILMSDFTEEHCPEEMENFLNAAAELPLDLKIFDLAMHCQQKKRKSPFVAKLLASSNRDILQKLALAYLQNKDLLEITDADVVSLIEKSQFPVTEPSPFLFLARYYLAQGNLAKAKELLRTLRSELPEIYLLLGKINERVSEYSEAQENYLLAAKKGSLEAMYKCAEVENPELWLLKATNRGYTPACYALASYYISADKFTEFGNLMKGIQYVMEEEHLVLKGIEAAPSFAKVSTELGLSQVALAYLQAGDIEKAKEYSSKIDRNSSDLNARFALGQIYEKVDLTVSIEHYLYCAAWGDRKAKKRITELFLARDVTKEKIPLHFYKEGMSLLNSTSNQKTLLANYLCTGEGLDKPDLAMGLEILAEAVCKANFIVLDFIAGIFSDQKYAATYRDVAFKILDANKTQYLSGKKGADIVKFLTAVCMQRKAIEEWLNCIKEHYPSFFHTKFTRLLDNSDFAKFYLPLLIEANRKKMSSNCVIL